NDNGSIQSIKPIEKIKNTDLKTKKVTQQFNPLNVPIYPEGRTSGVKANYIWDNTAYVLGVSEKPNKLNEKYQDFWKNVQAFDATNSKALQVLQKFPMFWEEHKSEYVEWIEANKKDFFDSNVVFRVLSLNNQFVHECDEFKKQWNSILEQYLSELSEGQCLIDGTTTKIADLHNPIKGVDNAQSSGALLVSFNKDSFESYGLKKGKNASVGTTAAFKYVTALNYLLRRGEGNKQRLKIGDAVTVFWAESDNSGEAERAESMMGEAINSSPEATKIADGQEINKLSSLLQQVARGIPLQTLCPDLNPATKFYVLGISPNAARLSIRFWYATTLEEMAQHIACHYQDLRLEPKPPRFNGLPQIWQLTYETAPIRDGKAKADDISPQLAGGLARAIFTGQNYPQSLLAQVLMRMRLDGEITFLRVSLCKAVINRRIRFNLSENQSTSCVSNNGKNKSKMEIPMSLDVEEKNPAYRMGRLFAVIEDMQKKALGEKINATIRDRYWGAASATPSLVFPSLMNNAKNHLSKIRKTDSYGKTKKISGEVLANILDWQVEQIIDGIGTSYPKNVSLEDQGRFAIGYYHQRFTRITKTKANEPVDYSSTEDELNTNSEASA
ncbi:MAG: type I-C CRISPR-associated protein Cas8c/Csd1, partial [Methylococcales bacterium]|nr:type I-C CRISPR-associated protein Cas8c/Csd1 [Methylococcales bacterium]